MWLEPKRQSKTPLTALVHPVRSKAAALELDTKTKYKKLKLLSIRYKI
jgi:hypothetical protein